MAKSHIRALEEIVERYSDDYSIDTSARHMKIALRHGKRTRKLATGKSPSDRNALRQFERDVRKAVHELKHGLTPGTKWKKQ